LRLLPSPKSIKTKLFLAMLMVSSGVAICMFLVMQWSFDRGFLHYVNTLDKERAAILSVALAEEFQNSGNWDRLVNNPRQWYRLLKGKPTRPFSEHAPNNLRHQPKHHIQSGIAKPARSSQQRPPRKPMRGRMVLLDANQQVIVGPRKGIKNFSLSPIKLNDQIIGYLGTKPMKQISDAHDLVFVQKQNQTFLIIAIAMIAISILISIPIAGHLVKPIKRLTQGTQHLTSGKFDTQIPITSRDELGTLSEDFNTLASTLKANEQARQQWVADISHELRTPLAILKGEIEAIEDGIRQPTTDNIASLGQEVNQLNHLVNDLYELSMSDIGALNYQKQTLDILPVVQHCVDTFADQFSAKDIDITFSADNLPTAKILVDPQRITQLINNLLNNSLRYTDQGGRSQITIEMKNYALLIHLQDSAPGVPPNELPKLFERLYRVEASRNRASGGAGLGLSICSNIASAHQGSINAQPSPLGGLWITVNLPMKKGANA